MLPRVNGWANYPTWALSLWLTSDDGVQAQVEQLLRGAPDGERAEALRVYVVAQFGSLGNPHDMISVGFAGDVFWWALDYVDFEAVARSLVGDDPRAE